LGLLQLQIIHDAIVQYLDTYHNYTSILSSAALSFLFLFIQLKNIVKNRGYLILVSISIHEEGREMPSRTVYHMPLH